MIEGGSQQVYLDPDEACPFHDAGHEFREAFAGAVDIGPIDAGGDLAGVAHGLPSSA